MITRLERRTRKQPKVNIMGGLYDLFDREMKVTYRLEDAEYEYVDRHFPEEKREELFVNPEELTFTQRRKVLTIFQELLQERKDASMPTLPEEEGDS